MDGANDISASRFGVGQVRRHERLIHGPRKQGIGREVETGEFAEVLECRCVVCASGLKVCAEDAEMDISAIYFDARRPTGIPGVNTLKSGRSICVRASVPSVSRLAAKPKIKPAIVQTIAVDVIDELRRWGAEQASVKILCVDLSAQAVPLRVGSNSVVSGTVRTQNRPPAEPRDIFDVGCVDQCKQVLREEELMHTRRRDGRRWPRDDLRSVTHEMSFEATAGLAAGTGAQGEGRLGRGSEIAMVSAGSLAGGRREPPTAAMGELGRPPAPGA